MLLVEALQLFSKQRNPTYILWSLNLNLKLSTVSGCIPVFWDKTLGRLSAATLWNRWIKIQRSLIILFHKDFKKWKKK